MPKNAYAESITSAELMAAGIKANGQRMSKRGIDSDFVAKLEILQKSARAKDIEQEDLKAKLKTATAKLDADMKELGKLMSEAKKEVKIEMEQESWKSFGIQDSK